MKLFGQIHELISTLFIDIERSMSSIHISPTRNINNRPLVMFKSKMHYESCAFSCIDGNKCNRSNARHDLFLGDKALHHSE
jgi:hypothetical protein